MNKYYHYTPETSLENIIESGVIKLATASTFDKKEKACAWVSSNPIWEHTATKIVHDGLGDSHHLSFEEQVIGFGCARIEVEPIGLYTWAKLRHLAKMNTTMADSMESVGLKQDANPSEWYGSLTPIDINRWIKAEVYRNGEWIEYDVFE
jgi:hypothetical protein